MNGDLSKLYTSAKDFYTLEGNIVMKLAPNAAMDVCRTADLYGLVVARIEGGIWHNPQFEARLDCIWDGIDLPTDPAEASKNNENAARFIDEEKDVHSAFIVTTAPMSGWPHIAK
jgi:Colicin-E5 Imm protein